MNNRPNFYLQFVSPDHPVELIPTDHDLIPAFKEFPDILMERYAAFALQALISKLHAHGKIVPVSGFRTQQEQQKIWDDTIKQEGLVYTQKYVAIPGCSEHQTGLAIDLALNKEKIDFICPSFPNEGICHQFQQLAPSYGFILRYPKGKEQITKIAWEPWHFRYVGTPHSQIISAHNLTFEEYLLNTYASKACIK